MFSFGNRKHRTFIFVMIALVLIGVVITFTYYQGINKSVDPRIRDARNLYEKYNGFVQSERYDSVFWLMDTIQSIYNSFTHYDQSYEIGVLYNNRAAAWLSSNATTVPTAKVAPRSPITTPRERRGTRSLTIG